MHSTRIDLWKRLIEEWGAERFGLNRRPHREVEEAERTALYEKVARSNMELN